MGMNKKRYVLGFLFDPDWESVLLIRKLRPEWQLNRLNGVGGKIEFGEMPSEAMEREFREETNVIVSKWTYFAATQFHGEEVFCFYASGAEIAFCDSVTDEIVMHCDINDLPPECLHNVPWLIQMAKCHNQFRLKFAYEIYQDAVG
jgi:8-oxo-dGTP pyrophosphatase MutT (NUDIX family)